jgi:hypothetical protein
MMLSWLGSLVLLALAFCLTVSASPVAADFSIRATCVECAVADRSARDTARRDRGEGNGWPAGQAKTLVAIVPGLPDVRILPVIPARVSGL